MSLRRDTLARALAGLALVTLITACGSSGPSNATASAAKSGVTGTPAATATATGAIGAQPGATATSSPTSVIGATGATPAATRGTQAAATSAPPPTQKPATTASAAAGIKISGTSTQHANQSASGSGGFMNNSDDLQATFTAHSTGSGSALVGTAHITYVKNHEQGDDVCSVKFTGNSVWDAQLTGEYHVQDDGSIVVSLSPEPTSGPPYTDQTNCTDLQVAPVWFGSGGTLVNGSFDDRKDIPSETGSSYLTTHIEVVP